MIDESRVASLEAQVYWGRTRVWGGGLGGGAECVERAKKGLHEGRIVDGVRCADEVKRRPQKIDAR